MGGRWGAAAESRPPRPDWVPCSAGRGRSPPGRREARAADRGWGGRGRLRGGRGRGRRSCCPAAARCRCLRRAGAGRAGDGGGRRGSGGGEGLPLRPRPALRRLPDKSWELRPRQLRNPRSPGLFCGVVFFFFNYFFIPPFSLNALSSAGAGVRGGFDGRKRGV